MTSTPIPTERTALTRCPRCQNEFEPTQAPAGQCPRCVLGLAMTPAAATAATAPTIAELQAHLPGYELQTLIGRGGMGVVYRARQLKLDRMVAIKILRPDLEVDPTFAERFEREARALARLDHPGIVGVHDFGRAGGFFFLVMEFVDGASLRELLAQGQLTAKDVLAFVPQLCDALQFAHDHRVVHRDIKPENILVDQDGRVRIADFGLAKLLGGEATALGLTQTRQAMGTPLYMAPEQVASAGAVDHRADLYSLGVVVYEMLTGTLPIGRFQPPSAKAKAVDALDPVVLKSLEADPEQRYQQARELKTDLQAAERLAAAPTPTPTPPPLPPAAVRGAAPEPGPVQRATREFPVGSWAGFAIVFMSCWLNWFVFPGRGRNSDAWSANVEGVPLWSVILFALAVAVARTAVAVGGAPPSRIPLVAASVGGMFVLLLMATAALSDEVGIGLGAFVTVACFATWTWQEVQPWVAARHRPSRRHGPWRRRLRH